ncbi:hypothetical protein I0D00_02275 [Pseudomonas lalucatii]|uniref:Uncharacterized protein n=1 Tax=Pseudomonas lalucatii TaxID=1424203 RepID=A0ABS5PW99_9PSED|nr:hypothetical protein [Pseudomonas lalucatii]MBS7660776.1 hypothetical protein [Pseudomonas lalucatii]QVM87550.1 hypothetical protein I0D68_21255 [Pseudomonas lalucatii]
MDLEAADDSVILYRFHFADGRSWDHRIALQPGTTEQGTALPDWTRLEFHQCRHCPLRPEQSPRCPFAQALVAPVELLAQSPSYERVEVEVHWRGRETRQHTTLQRALGSLLGALGATSGCPHTRMLKAMAWFHQPFSGTEETLFRVFGSYLLGQYLRQQRGLSADWSMSGLREVYRNLRQVNLGMSGRLRAAVVEDSGPNGMVLLDLLAADTLYSLEQYEGELDRFFQAYFE